MIVGDKPFTRSVIRERAHCVYHTFIARSSLDSRPIWVTIIEMVQANLTGIKWGREKSPVDFPPSWWMKRRGDRWVWTVFSLSSPSLLSIMGHRPLKMNAYYGGWKWNGLDNGVSFSSFLSPSQVPLWLQLLEESLGVNGETSRETQEKVRWWCYCNEL